MLDVNQLALSVQAVEKYIQVWSNKGGSASQDALSWKPLVPEGYYSIGSYVQGDAGPPTENVLVVKPLIEGAVSYPVDYQVVYTNEKAESELRGSVWRPVPPVGYQAVGYVFHRSYDKPKQEEVVCIREDLLLPGSVGIRIWGDLNSGSLMSVSLYKVVSSDPQAISCNSFFAVPTHDRPFSNPFVFCLNAQYVDLPEISRCSLESLIDKHAPKLHFHKEELYFPCGVEWMVENSDLIDTKTGKSQNINLRSLPKNDDDKSRYYLKLSDQASRSGDLNSAKAYVHAKIINHTFLDLQYWFLFSFNGAAEARIKWSQLNAESQSQSLSLEPLEEHEGDWESVTVRLDRTSLEIKRVCFSHRGKGQWYLPQYCEFNNKQLQAYASKKTHATYPTVATNYSEYRVFPASAPCKLEFWLVDETNKGDVLDSSLANELISAEFLRKEERPEEPRWLTYTNRWGEHCEESLSQDRVKKAMENACANLEGVNGDVLCYLPDLIDELYPIFWKEIEEGALGPKMKRIWQDFK